MNTPFDSEALKAELLANNPEFRELFENHHLCDDRLNQISAIQFPTDQEQLEEHDLKKLKLKYKDDMQAILARMLQTSTV
ncbi:MAG: DUF465 domain-containing protein [Acidobacteria bacterium]|nr:DUF465 domain-containing protein [Acidobacteriota bacterium]